MKGSVVAVVLCGLLCWMTPARGEILVASKSVWKYLDDGSDQGTNWIAPSFDDATWASGPAELGYGDLRNGRPEATVLCCSDAPTRSITYYFRHRFLVADPTPYVVGQFRVLRDDGVVVYLNGREVFRDNLPAGTIANRTPALTNASDDGTVFLSATVPPGLLVAGENVIAAEIHQQSATSSDISFDLEFSVSTQNERPTIALVSPGEGAFYTAPATVSMTASASDSDGSVALVEFFQGATKLGEDTTPQSGTQFTFDWPNVPAGSYALHVVATDNLGALTTSAVVNVNVGAESMPIVAGKSPAPGIVSSLSSITVTFSENVSGVGAGDLLINGVAAAAVSGSASNYTFSFSHPAEGTVFIGWNGEHGIADLENPPKPFDSFSSGATWQYTLADTVAPIVARVSPQAETTLRKIDSIKVTFSEAVLGVDATDLRINGTAATSVTGKDAGPYEFRFAPLPNGAVNVTWTASHGITDRAAARNAFAGEPWSYTLNTNAVWEGQVVINEIMYHPTHDQTAFVPEPIAEEYIELFNRGSNAVNLAGWRLNRAVEFNFPNTNLAAGGYLVVAANVTTFRAKYPMVVNVVGGWTGRLSNNRDEVELEDASGNRVDLVEYADEGDWAVRTATDLGWEWVSAADGFGSSLELRQSALHNSTGQNWAASTDSNGTPGAANSRATANLAPMILDVSHLPAIPRSTNSITILARIVDESPNGLTVWLWYRDATTLRAFTSVPMLDNGSSNDGAARDGVFGVVLPPMANRTITEFYVEASDADSNAGTWPAAADLGGGTFAQEANALFQVDDEAYTGKQPVYRIVMRANDRNDLFNFRDRIQRNATFITVQGSDVQVRHNCIARRRGQSSFGSTPPTMKFGIPTDRLWNNKSSLNLNSVNTYAQVLGSALSLKAGLPAPYARAVQVRFNGINEANGGAGMFGSYAHVEVVDGEWARDHYPDDPNGNAYSKRRPLCNFEYLLPATPQSYVGCAYDKESNISENDWNDLLNLFSALDPDATPANDYVRAMRQNANVEMWLRYFAVLFLMNYTETALANGVDDDFNMYRGVVDPRFLLLPNDFDQIFGSDPRQPSTPNDIFLAAAIPNVSRFLRHSEFQPLFYAEYRRQLAGAFATNQLFPLMDQVLGDWVQPGVIQNMRNNAQGRIDYVLRALPAAPVDVRVAVSGEPESPTYLNTATLNVVDADITHYRYRVSNGAWSADQLAGQPINLTGLANGHYTVYVIGRNSAGTWQTDADATISKTWTVLSSLRGVVINEVLARNDSAVNHEGTFPDLIELFNAGESSVDLSGLHLTDDLDNPNKFTFPPGTTLGAGAWRVVFANNPEGTGGLHTGFGLDQNGDQVYLLDRATNGFRVLDSVTFGWQLADLSVGRLSNGQWDLCTPTSGGPNTATATGSAATLKINEWLPSPASWFVDDFIELYNPDALPVNLGGLFMTDKPIGHPFQHKMTPLSFIDGYGYRAFIADGNKSAGPDHLDFSLSAETGEIALLASSGAIIDSVVYGQQFDGVSQGRSPNGGSRIVYFDLATRGAGNPAAPEPQQPQLVNLVPYNHFWRYEQTGTDFGIAWRATNYDDSQWPSGPGLLAAVRPGGTLPEPVLTTLTVPNTKPTIYFRTRFLVANLAQLSALQLTGIFDDGAVVYLNGVEVYRYNLPSGPINSSTLASGNILDPTYQAPINLPLTELRAGTNHLAVEIHQASLTSQDIVLGVRLDGVILTNNPGLAGIKINEVLAIARETTNSDGTVTDWVELYNPSNGQIELAGMSFTDQLANPRRWVFPQGSVIAAMGRGVVRFDSGAPPTTNAAAVLNTGFGLKASGDSLYLFNRPQSGGEVLDAISFGIQAPDWSIGRVPNGGSNWVLNLPTQGSANIAATLGNPALLRVNEWIADPSGGGDWFELYNPGAQPVELSGLYLTKNLNDRLQYPPIPALSYIAAALSGFLKIIADDNPAAGADHVPFALSRNGDSIGLSDRFGVLIDHVTFGPQSKGVSQGRLPDGATNVVFFPGTATPEESNYLPIPNVVINEVLTHTDAPLEDAIELRNVSSSLVNIGGWFLSDSRTTLKKYRIPNGTMIPANGFRVFYEIDFNSNNLVAPFSLDSARGDEVHLAAADAGGQLTGYRIVADFGPAANGVSFGRYNTSSLNGNRVDFTALAQRTFGADNPRTVDDFRTGTGRTNSGPLVGLVVISEIMYHPPELPGGGENEAEEFIELRNITASAVPLYHSAYPAHTWRLRDAVDFDFPPNVSIPVNGLILVVRFDPVADPAALSAFRTKYNLSPNVAVYGPYRGRLDNGSDSVELYRPDTPQQPPGPDARYVPYVLVDRVAYSDAPPWPTNNVDGFGYSLQRLNAADYGNDPVNWTAAPPSAGVAIRDTDGDGLPDDWEIAHGLNPNSATGVNGASGDPDGDGLTNLEEYHAGTDPQDRGNVLRLEIVFGNPPMLQLLVQPNKTYTIEFRENVDSGPWRFLTEIPPVSTPRLVEVPETPPTARRFYRLRTP